METATDKKKNHTIFFFFFFLKPFGTALDEGLAHMHLVDYLNSTSFNRERDATLQKCWHERQPGGSCRADGVEGAGAGSDDCSRIVTGTPISHSLPSLSTTISPLYGRAICYSQVCNINAFLSSRGQNLFIQVGFFFWTKIRVSLNCRQSESRTLEKVFKILAEWHIFYKCTVS